MEMKNSLDSSIENAKTSDTATVTLDYETLPTTPENRDDADIRDADEQEELHTEESHEVSSNGHITLEQVQEETPREELISNVEERLNSEIEELLALLGLSQSMVQVTNEMLVPPEGEWSAPVGYRAIVNPGGVGQPRDGDPRAAFMIYDTERGFTFYRIHYDYEKTQEKILKAGLPPYLAARLGYGR